MFFFTLLTLCLTAIHAQKCGKSGVEWDYIIIGAGPGGSAAAAYLHTLNPSNTNVLLLERGMDRNKELDDLPFMDTYLGGAQSFWPAGEHTSYSNVNPNGGTPWEQVKTLGGNQAANAGMYSAGDNKEFAGIFNVQESLVESIKAWVASYIKPRFVTSHPYLESHATGLGVPFRKSDECSVTSTLYGTGVKPFIGRCESPSAGCLHSYRWYDAELGEGLRRTSFYKAYFYDQGIQANKLYQRNSKDKTTGNFFIKTNTEVMRLVFTKKSKTNVAGVKARGSDFCLSRTGKVILAAGAFETAALLLRSGITAQGGAGTNFHEHGAVVISDPNFTNIFGAIGDLNKKGTTACPIIEGELLFNGGGAKEKPGFVGSTKFEFVYFVDCNNCLQAMYASWFQNDKRGTITIDANGAPVVDYGWDYSAQDRQAMWEALEYFEKNSGIGMQCNAATYKSFQDTIDLLKNATPADMAKNIIKFWHASGACSAGICFDDQTGVVFDTDNVFVGDTSTFPFPVSAHLSVASNVAGAIAAYKASGGDTKLFSKHEIKGMTCQDLSNGLVDSAEEREQRCTKFGNKSSGQTKKTCNKAKGKIDDTVFTIGQAVVIKKGLMTSKAGIIECENGMMYHMDDICTTAGVPPKLVTVTCTCPDAIEPSSVFVPFKTPAGSCPTCQAVVAPTYVSRADVATHTNVDTDCWVILWPHCPSKTDMCAGRSAGSASAMVAGCSRNDYYLLNVSQNQWNHPGGRWAIKNRCGGDVFAWTTFGKGADGSGHAPSLNSGAMPALQVPDTKLFNIFDGCP